MVIDELKEWDWSNSSKKDSVRIMYEELSEEAGVQTQEGTNKHQRTRNIQSRMPDFIVTSNDMVNDECELIHCAFYADIESVNVTEALKDPKWMNFMIEELDSIEVNKTWSLVDLSHGNKAIYVKSVFKVKLSSKGEMIRHKQDLWPKGFFKGKVLILMKYLH